MSLHFQNKPSLPPLDPSPTFDLHKNKQATYTNTKKTTIATKMFRLFSTLLTLAALGYGIFWVNDIHPEWKQKFLSFTRVGSFEAFEPRFSPHQIAKKSHLHLPKESLLSSHSSLAFHPYLLMKVKFMHDSPTTREGTVLWDLIQGEMVLDTRDWKTTHGFSDCIQARATQEEYRILYTIANNEGGADLSLIRSALQLSHELAQKWIERCEQKNLVVQRGEAYHIHLENPLFSLKPSTHIATPLIASTHTGTSRLPKRFSHMQIKKAAQEAFGTHFAIREMREIFLPVYSIQVDDGDGSTKTTFWNGLTGKQMHHHTALIE